MSKNSNEMGSNLVFFLIGAGIGAGVALLYAPREGEHTRKMIGEKAMVARDKAAEVTENVTNVAKEKWTGVKDSVSEMVSNAPKLGQNDSNHAIPSKEPASSSSEI